MRIDTTEIVRLVVPDECPDTSYLDQTEFEDRRQQYRDGDFYFIGIRASIEIQIPSKSGGYWNLQTIQSPGLWGIESDSADDYLSEVFKEEKAVLIEMLETLGVTCSG
jgi:hypothetical protein